MIRTYSRRRWTGYLGLRSRATEPSACHPAFYGYDKVCYAWSRSFVQPPTVLVGNFLPDDIAEEIAVREGGVWTIYRWNR